MTIGLCLCFPIVWYLSFYFICFEPEGRARHERPLFKSHLHIMTSSLRIMTSSCFTYYDVIMFSFLHIVTSSMSFFKPFFPPFVPNSNCFSSFWPIFHNFPCFFWFFIHFSPLFDQFFTIFLVFSNFLAIFQPFFLLLFLIVSLFPPFDQFFLAIVFQCILFLKRNLPLEKCLLRELNPGPLVSEAITLTTGLTRLA